MSKHIKVLSINCFDSPLSLSRLTRIKELVNRIIERGPDVVCLQEIIFNKTTESVSNLFNESGYSCIRVPGGLLNKGGLMFASRLPIVSSYFHPFHYQGNWSLQLTDRLLHKGFQRIEVLFNQKKLNIVNTHLVCVYNPVSKEQQISLKLQLDELLGTISKLEDNLILCGDLNFSEYSSLYKYLMTKTKLIDPLVNSKNVTVSSQNSHRQGVYKGGSGLRLDYVMLTKNFEVMKQEILFTDIYDVNNVKMNLSDHYGIYTSAAFY